MSSPIFSPPLLPLPLPPPFHPLIVLSCYVEDLLTVSMFLFLVLFLVVASLCCKRSETSDGGELPENLDIQAPVFHYGGDDEGEQECVICLCEIEEREKCRKMKTCGHVFHKGCIDRWFRVERHCPLCRTSVCVVVDRGENARGSSSSSPSPLD